ncbi:MAG TPA: sodium:calcium antiporter [Candidatus Limnocylindria bacterium]|nr:sodium:calcium antiporter [Candidatus Limnocylindria bacterium]
MDSFLRDAGMAAAIPVFVLSLFLLTKSADALVDGAARLAGALGMPQVVIGATVVSLGTSLPELAAGTAAALRGSAEFALGNAAGSVITNTSLVLGMGALLGAIPVRRENAGKVVMLAVAALLLLVPSYGLALMGRPVVLPQWWGALLLAGVPAYLVFAVRFGRRSAAAGGDKGARGAVRAADVARIVLGAGGVAAFAAAMVSSASVIAAGIGVPDAVVAATIVAVGTSAPEISTTVASARKGMGSLALGNVVGANVLNILLVLGAAAAVSPRGITVPAQLLRVHLPALAFILAVFMYFVFNRSRHELNHREGLFLVALYGLYLAGNAVLAFAAGG